MRTLSVPLNTDLIPGLLCVEVMTFFQIPAFHIVGLPAREVEEARERIRAAIEATGFEFPRRRIVLNLSPAHVRKRGTGLDLPMALAVLLSAEPAEGTDRFAAWGELGLDGSLKSVGQVTRAVHAAGKGGLRALILPSADLAEAARAARLITEAEGPEFRCPTLLGASDLREAWERLRGRRELARPLVAAAEPGPVAPQRPLLALAPPLARMLGVAAAGRHHLMLLGPRGGGKSHALDALAALQPPMSAARRLRQVLALELAGAETAFAPEGVVRRVGTTPSLAALIGTARPDSLVPGEFTLADGGLLLADELPEWNRLAREALREPLQTGTVTLARAGKSVQLPARFRLAANGNLCPCGAWPPRPAGEADIRLQAVSCRCPEAERRRYLSRLSGPVLDRIDMVSVLAGSRAAPGGSGQPIEALAPRVREIRREAIARYGAPPGELGASAIEELMQAHRRWREILDERRLASLRSVHQCVRVGLTLALWDGLAEPGPAHLTEATFFRPEKLGVWD